MMNLYRLLDRVSRICSADVFTDKCDIAKMEESVRGEADKEFYETVTRSQLRYIEALDDDFNVSRALAALFEFTRHTHRTMDAKGLSAEDKGKIEDVLQRINSVLGVLDLEEAKMDQEIEALVKGRDTYLGR